MAIITADNHIKKYGVRTTKVAQQVKVERFKTTLAPQLSNQSKTIGAHMEPCSIRI